MKLTKLLNVLLMSCAVWIACVHAPPVEHKLPTIHLNFEPKNVIAMESVTFSASVEGNRDGISFVWDFDASDGMQTDAIGSKATHIYPAAGSYKIRLTATDGRGRTQRTSDRVTVTARKYASHPPITLVNQTFPPDQPHLIEAYEIQADGKDAIYLCSCANVVIRNCYLHDSDYAIRAEGCRNIRVVGCRIDKNKRGILFEGAPENLSHDIKVSRNVVTHCTRENGISFRWAANVEVDGNVLKDNGEIWADRISGISFNGLFQNISIHDNFVARSNSDGIELMGERRSKRSDQIQVYRNTLRDNGEQGVWMVHLVNGHVHHNLIFGSHNNGVCLEWDVSKTQIDHNVILDCGGIPGAKHHGGGAIGISDSFDNLIENNVLTESTITGISIYQSTNDDMRNEEKYPFVSRDNIIRNNIIVDNAEGNIVVGSEVPGTQISYNDVWKSQSGRDYHGCKPGPGNISVNPRFRNPTAGDFMLRDDSPCRDAGDPKMQDTDGSRIDMGIGIPKDYWQSKFIPPRPKADNYAEAKETEIPRASAHAFYEDFESGVDDWDLSSGWSIISEDGNHILQGTQHTFATAYLDGVVNKLELKLKLLQGTIHLNIRSKSSSEGLNRYFIGFNKNGSYIQKQLGSHFQSLIEHGRGISLNKWHKIKLELIKDTIKVFSDDEVVFSIQDKELVQEGGISFETLDDSRAYIDEVRVETEEHSILRCVVPPARQIQAKELFPDGEHKGDITLKGRDFLRLENGEFEQFGNIYLKDSSRLILRDAVLYISRYQRLLNHWGIHLQDKAFLELENSKVAPGKEALVVVDARDRARVKMKNSPTEIHLFTMSGNADAIVENSEIVGEIGGLIGASGKAQIKVIDSKIGAVNLWIASGATFSASGLGTGLFQKWKITKTFYNQDLPPGGRSATEI